MLKLPVVESISAISWLPHSPHLLGLGSSMGWARVYDIRHSSASPVISWLPHPSNRPRKVQGMRSDLLAANYLATFSDAAGDQVKVWDLRYLAENNLSASKTKPVPVVSINPNASTVGVQEGTANAPSTSVVTDIAWSPTRSGLLAIACSNNKHIAFYKCDRSRRTEDKDKDSGSGVASPVGNPSSSVLTQAVFTIPTGDATKCLSWQSDLLVNLRTEANILGFDGVGVTVHSEASPIWEKCDLDKMEEFMNVPTTKRLRPLVWNPPTSKRLLAVTASSIVDSDVREATGAMGMSATHVITAAQDRLHIRNIDEKLLTQTVFTTGLGHKEHVLAVEAVLRAVLTDMDALMQERCTAGYSTDSSANIDLLVEELDAVYRQLQLAWLTGSSAHGLSILPYYAKEALVSRTDIEGGIAQVAHMQELYRAWLWLDRIITDMAYKRGSTGTNYTTCGVVSILASDEEAKAKQSLLGIKYYTSPQRAAVHKVCGWVEILETARGAGHRSSSLAAGHDLASLHTFLEEEQSVACFERVVALSVWHGDVDFAVHVLSQTIEHYEHFHNSTVDQTTSSEDYDVDQPIDWDHAITREYIKVIGMVAACFAGYSCEDAANHSNHTNGRNAWISVCKYTINQLQSIARVHTHYLISACFFLLVHLDHANSGYDFFEDQLRQLRGACRPFHINNLADHSPTMPMLTGHAALLLHAGYQCILYNPWLTLGDRMAFAASYLEAGELEVYVDYMNIYCVCFGVLEGLLLTGFTADAFTILQQYTDRTADLQSVALIVSSFAAYYNTNYLTNTNSSLPISRSSTNMIHNTKAAREQSTLPGAHAVSKSLLQRSNEWILSYRSLLNSWKMFVERAHFDIELNILTKTYSATDSSKHSSAATTSIHQDFKLPSALLESQKCHVKLKCKFCTKMLPLDEFPMAGLEGVRSQKHILNYCTHCKNALPRCYICQLHLVSPSSPSQVAGLVSLISQGLLNPYVHALRLSDRNYRDSLSRQEPLENANSMKKSSSGSLTPSAGGKDEGIFAGLDFGRWVLFCQHCRHGGHAHCLVSWFTGSPGVMSCGDADKQYTPRVVCGVNGCNCQCQLIA